MTHFHVHRWQASLILLSAAIATVILLAIFVISTVRIITGRSGEWTEGIQNPVIRAEYVAVSSKLVQENGGLREALSCADAHYEILANSVGYGMAVDPGCDMKISFFDADKIRKEIPHSIYGYSNFRIEHDGKYYSLVMLPS